MHLQDRKHVPKWHEAFRKKYVTKTSFYDGERGQLFQLYTYTSSYPFSHHGSVENHPKWEETNIGDTPPFATEPWWEDLFFLLDAAWVRSRAERPSVSEVNEQLHVQFGCKLSQVEAKQMTNYEIRIKKGCVENSETWADNYIHCRGAMGYIPGTRWPGWM